MRILSFCFGSSRQAATWRPAQMSFDELYDKLASPIRTPETTAQYHKMKKGEKDAIKDKGGFLAGTLKGTRRKKSEVVSRSMITLDCDKLYPSFFEEYEFLGSLLTIVYTTHTHLPEAPRARVLIPLTRDVTPEEYNAIARYLAYELGMEMIDPCSFEINQLMYWPTASIDGEYICRRYDGDWLDPDAFLAGHPHWRDCASLPTTPSEKENMERLRKKQEDPLAKDGTVGAFCRAYTIQKAMQTFLADVYEETDDGNRWRYIPSDSIPGVVVYDDKFAYSHHASDPAYGRLMNAFDLVRTHLFRDLDENCPLDTPISKMPSFKAMTDFAIKDDKVKAVFAEERAAKAATEFADEDWQQRLDLDKAGNVKNTLRNLTIILENDPNLKPLVFNQLLDGMEIKGEVPWRHPSKFWRDADDAQLISYVDTHYGTFSARNYDIAVTKVSDDRSYHPIRSFIEQLPEWDGIERVNTLLIDYLGADDTEYVRAVTRKTLCAAISRVLQPGCKFDSMLVLNGPQGVGKSTLIAKLAGEWFSDSLNLSDTKDKTAAEKLQGYWILEIGELAGLKKAEVETLRSFLSRQNDIYRASFGKRATPHLRQCVFFGTTNAESGYLRDTTGNRRFWPVKTPGTGEKHSWELTAEDVQQIWAEVLVYVKRGEKLYLDSKMEGLAKNEQREAMESDEREGLVRDYLDTLLPVDWPEMDIFERRGYLNGSDFGPTHKTGSVKRTCVSNMEIWCECFGKDRANLHRADSNELTGILARLGWKRVDAKVRIPLYGPQYIFVPKDRSQ